jgi:hypothetical protein
MGWLRVGTADVVADFFRNDESPLLLRSSGMKAVHAEKAQGTELITGLWHILSMTTWGEDYFNEEVQAFIEIEDNRTGHFQFGQGRTQSAEKWMSRSHLARPGY